MTRLEPSQRLAVCSVLAAMALAVLDAGIVNVALPIFSREFQASASDTVLVVTFYQAALLIGLMPAAHIGERIGHRRTFAVGIGLFSGAASLCALAPTLPVLLVARIMQGLGGAAIMSLGIALLRLLLGNERLGAAIAWNGLVVASCSAAGPAIGGFILSVAPWPWLFLSGLPLGAAAFAASFFLPRDRAAEGRLDWPSIALHAATVILFVLAAGVALASAWLAIAAAGSAAALMALLVRRAGSQEAPLLPLDLLARGDLALQASASVCCFIGQSIAVVALPFHLQAVLSQDLVTMGLVLACWPAGAACTSLVLAHVTVEADRATLCAMGGAILGTGLLLLASPISAQNAVLLSVNAALCGVGFALFQFANNHVLFLGAPTLRAAAAGGLQGTARLTGQTAGTLIMALIFAAGSAALAPRFGFAVAAVFALAAALVAGIGGRCRAGVRAAQERHA